MAESIINELRALLPNCLPADRRRLLSALTQVDRPAGSPATGQVRWDRLLRDAQRSVALRHRRHERLPPVSYPPQLPITARREDIVATLRANQVVIIAGETGSGKTTQIPKMLLEAGFGIEGTIGCTQPRRVAALSISRRIAAELNTTWGREVGCKIRFSDQSSPETYIKLMTDGILLAEAQGDPDLLEYEAIVIDEAHERSLNIDFLLGHLKNLLRRRLELRLVITSATINVEAFSQAFNNAPIIEVSGRLYPVEIRYAPHDPEAEESGDLTYIDATVRAVEGVMDESTRGDILIFMPGERDIRETRDDLEGRYGGSAEIVPLFGRLSSGEQERAFAPTQKRKIIIATNIAETSLTIPGIRYVIDPGLARISRYSPRTRTKRLPIEPVSQSSARQRAGRSGRVENGVCIRLYAEADYAERPADTPPEIQRANLAEVILRMKAFGLGEIETFPFLEPPQPPAIRSGYQLLQELGALDEDQQLTRLGRDLARLPVDPAIGRMVLQSVREDALAEVLVIAAGLSIQDPRERPLEKQLQADQAHRQFLDPHSDFLALLNIWHAYHEKWEALKTQNQLRKFCQANFLSYVRMREWRDVHAQLQDALPEVLVKGRRFPSPPRLPAKDPPGGARASVRSEASDASHAVGASSAGDPDHRLSTTRASNYDGIHRSILAGLLGHIGQRFEKNIYRISGNRQVMAFPGSALFDRQEKKKGSHTAPQGKEPTQPSQQPAWIMAGEIVETNRLYARTLARIDPAWIVELGNHICRRSYAEPHWNRASGRVLVKERITLFGLEIQEKNIDYGKVNAAEATEMFIREALLQEDIDLPHPFLAHNRKLAQRVEVARTRSRDRSWPEVDTSLFEFYTARLRDISSVHDLNRVVRAHAAEPDFLLARETDFTGGEPLAWDATAFPPTVPVLGLSLSVDYSYAPGEVHDGITINVPGALAHRVEPAMLDWIVPGLREEQVQFFLKALPKTLRVPLMPLPPKAKQLAAELAPGAGIDDLISSIRRLYGVEIPPGTWDRSQLPDHLRPRLAIIGGAKEIVASGRDITELKRGLAQHETPTEQQAWARAVALWERYDLTEVTLTDMPERLEVAAVSGVPWHAFPGLEVEERRVHLKLFRQREEAERASRNGYVRLAELTLQRELAWMQKDLRGLAAVNHLYVTLGAPDELLKTAYENLVSFLLPPPRDVLPLLRARLESLVAAARTSLPGLAPKLIEAVKLILEMRQQILLHRKPYPGMRQDLDRLVPATFLRSVPFGRLPHLARYLKAMLVRAERAAVNPARDQDKARMLLPYLSALGRLQGQPLTPDRRLHVEEFRWLLEEFKVSIFAQELGTAQPVSAKRLDASLAMTTTELTRDGKNEPEHRGG